MSKQQITIGRTVIFFPSLQLCKDMGLPTTTNAKTGLPAVVVSVEEDKKVCLAFFTGLPSTPVASIDCLRHASECKEGESCWDWPLIQNAKAEQPQKKPAAECVNFGQYFGMTEERCNELADNCRAILKHYEPLVNACVAFEEIKPRCNSDEEYQFCLFAMGKFIGRHEINRGIGLSGLVEMLGRR